MEYWLSLSPVPGMVLWVILYVSDYYLTLYSVRGFKESDYFSHEGSFELTPQYQKDVDALARISKRHIVLLVMFTLVIGGLWWFCSFLPYGNYLYLLYLGLFILLEAAVHFRHLRNVHLIRTIKRQGGVEGHIKYLRYFSYRISAFELYMFAALYFFTALLTYSPFFLGGSLACLGTGIRHGFYARKELARKRSSVGGHDGNSA